MNNNLKKVLVEITPPFLKKATQKIIKKFDKTQNYFEWEYIPTGWDYLEDHPEIRGWNAEEILEVYKKKWPKFLNMTQGVGPLGIMHESDLSSNTDLCGHNVVMSSAYVAALASHKKDVLKILDWGGGIGHFYLFLKQLLPDINIDYHCKDVPALAGYGQSLFPRQHFYTDESCLKGNYDLVLVSTSFQYSCNWQELLGKFACACNGFLYIAELPIVQRAPSFVFIQRPYKFGYNTEYLGWCLNRTEFLDHAQSCGLVLLREFVYGLAPVIEKAPEQNEYRGFLFKPTSLN